jgi:nicotinamidase-related amidase
MPLTQIDAVAGLVVIDLQKGIVGLPTAHPAGEVVERAARLARAFRGRGWPVVLVHVTGVSPGRTDAGGRRLRGRRIGRSWCRSWGGRRRITL